MHLCPVGIGPKVREGPEGHASHDGVTSNFAPLLSLRLSSRLVSSRTTYTCPCLPTTYRPSSADKPAYVLHPADTSCKASRSTIPPKLWGFLSLVGMHQSPQARPHPAHKHMWTSTQSVSYPKMVGTSSEPKISPFSFPSARALSLMERKGN